jgi:hypothetical protein
MNIARTIVAALAAAAILIVTLYFIATDPPTPQDFGLPSAYDIMVENYAPNVSVNNSNSSAWPTAAPTPSGLVFGVDRFVDREAGVVCWTVGVKGRVQNAISCLPLDQTELEVEN